MTFKLAFLLHLFIPIGIISLFSYTQLISKKKKIKSFVLYYSFLFLGYFLITFFVDNAYLFSLLGLIMQLGLSYIYYLDSYKKVYQITLCCFFIQLVSYALTIIPLSFLFSITPQISLYFDREFTIYAFMLYDSWFLSLSVYYVLEFTNIKENISFFKFSTLFVCQAIFTYIIFLLSFDLPILYFAIIMFVVMVVIGISDYVLVKTYKSIILNFLGLLEEIRFKEILRQEKELKHIKKQIYQDLEKTQNLLIKQQDQEAHNYIKNKYNELKNMNIEHYSDNKMLDLVIYNKVQIMKEKDIYNSIDISLYQNTTIDDIDLITLLFNILDNAIEACEKITTKRFIHVKIYEKYNCLYIEVMNSKNPDDLFGSLKTTKADSINHGIGTTIIKNIVRKYKGDVLFEDNKDTFRVKLFLMN